MEAYNFGGRVACRRPVTFNFQHDNIRVFQSCMPDVAVSRHQLEAEAATDPRKRLQLGDALMVGFNGWPQDHFEGTMHYFMAAYDTTEETFDACLYRKVYPIGNCEAVAMVAYMLGRRLKADHYQSDDEPSYGGFEPIFRKSVRRGADPELLRHVKKLVFMYSELARRGWVCPNGLNFAKELKNTGLQNHAAFADSGVDRVIRALEMHIKKEELEAMIQDGRVVAPKPSMERLGLFEPKAGEIFRKLPLQPDGQVSGDIHVEYRLLSLSSFDPGTVTVFVVFPQSNMVQNVISLPSHWAMNPYNPEALRFVWLHFAYAFHLGVKGARRFRPKVVTMLDKDSKFATFLKENIGQNCGTEVQIISRNHQVRGESTIQQVMDVFETSMIEQMMVDSTNSDEMLRRQVQTQQRRSLMWANKSDVSLEEAVQRADALREEGNGLFKSERYVAAQNCYSSAVDFLRGIVDRSVDVNLLLAKILSNRAICSMKMAADRNAELAIKLFEMAVIDCESVLKSSWSNSLPSQLIQKMYVRVSKAFEQKTILVNRIHGRTTPRQPNLNNNSRSSSYSGRGERYRNGGVSAAQNLHQRRTEQQNNRKAQQEADRIAQELLEEEEREQARNQRKNNNHKKKGKRKKKNRNINKSANDAPPPKAEEPKFILMLGKDLMDSGLALNVTKEDDFCPICFGLFKFEHADSLNVVLKCNHGFCVRCISMLIMQRDENHRHCPLCKGQFEPGELKELPKHIFESSESLQKLAGELHLDHDEDKEEIACNLLKWNHFDVARVESMLEDMLSTSSRADFFEIGNLSSEQKQEIYEEARKPVRALRKELHALDEQLDQTFDSQSERWHQLKVERGRVLKNLKHAEENARQVVFHHINSAEGMGIETDDGEFKVDFHALHKNEAKHLLDHMILPVLPILGSVIIITGRGKHNEDGSPSALREFVISYVTTNETSRRIMKYEPVQGNEGRIRIKSLI